jgi:hypothetical protein
MSEDTAIGLLVVGAGVIIVGLIIVLVMRRERKRRESLIAAAGQLGGRFDKRPDSEFAKDLSKVFWVFRYYRKRAVTNLIERPGAEATFRLFDYAYLRPGSRSPSMWSVVLVSSPRLQLPKFTMGNMGGALRLRDKFVSEPVVFPVSEFCEAHKVHAEDDAATINAFSDKLQRHLADRQRYCMEGDGNHFVMYEPDRRVRPEQVRAVLDDAQAILTEFL